MALLLSFYIGSILLLSCFVDNALCDHLKAAGERKVYKLLLEATGKARQSTMRFSTIAAAATVPLAASVRGVNVVVSNDDGWAVSNIRSLYHALQDGGYDTIVSAPAENQSGTGSSDAEPDVVARGCEFGSCPPGSPAVGNNASDTNLNYVNSFPVTSMRYGIQNLSSTSFCDNGEADLALSGTNHGRNLGGYGPAELALSGPNHGRNLGGVTAISGTVGAAVAAASLGIPAIAFSGVGKTVAWDKPTPKYSDVFADLALIVTNELVASGKPYLPSNTWLNVNFPAVSEECAKPSDFKFVLTRIYPGAPYISHPDVETCGNDGRLTSERWVSLLSGCYVSISVGSPRKDDASLEKQAAVLKKLEGILSCLPE